MQLHLPMWRQKTVRELPLSVWEALGRHTLLSRLPIESARSPPDCSIFWVYSHQIHRDAYRSIGEVTANDYKADVERLVKRTPGRESAGSWLMIVDNADSSNLASLARHFLSGRKASLLLSSWNRGLILQIGVPAFKVFDIEGMSENEGLKFLMRDLTKCQMSNRDDIAELLDFVGYLPLAIGQASTLMANDQIPSTQYLKWSGFPLVGRLEYQMDITRLSPPDI